ncbi:MAG TPA: hypothetical protein PKC84_09735 [Paracoccaceae bacterium]|nr:hypothetical protein [Paracoccaceae bacterium]
MEWLVWAGVAMTLLGVAGLARCVQLAYRVRKGNLPPDQARATLQKVVALNMGALGLSALGLAAVVAGILLG